MKQFILVIFHPFIFSTILCPKDVIDLFIKNYKNIYHSINSINLYKISNFDFILSKKDKNLEVLFDKLENNSKMFFNSGPVQICKTFVDNILSQHQGNIDKILEDSILYKDIEMGRSVLDNFSYFMVSSEYIILSKYFKKNDSRLKIYTDIINNKKIIDLLDQITIERQNNDIETVKRYFELFSKSLNNKNDQSVINEINSIRGRNLSNSTNICAQMHYLRHFCHRYTFEDYLEKVYPYKKICKCSPIKFKENENVEVVNLNIFEEEKKKILENIENFKLDYKRNLNKRESGVGVKNDDNERKQVYSLEDTKKLELNKTNKNVDNQDIKNTKQKDKFNSAKNQKENDLKKGKKKTKAIPRSLLKDDQNTYNVEKQECDIFEETEQDDTSNDSQQDDTSNDSQQDDANLQFIDKNLQQSDENLQQSNNNNINKQETEPREKTTIDIQNSDENIKYSDNIKKTDNMRLLEDSQQSDISDNSQESFNIKDSVEDLLVDSTDNLLLLLEPDNISMTSKESSSFFEDSLDEDNLSDLEKCPDTTNSKSILQNNNNSVTFELSLDLSYKKTEEVIEKDKQSEVIRTSYSDYETTKMSTDEGYSGSGSSNSKESNRSGVINSDKDNESGPSSLEEHKRITVSISEESYKSKNSSSPNDVFQDSRSSMSEMEVVMVEEESIGDGSYKSSITSFSNSESDDNLSEEVGYSNYSYEMLCKKKISQLDPIHRESLSGLFLDIELSETDSEELNLEISPSINLPTTNLEVEKCEILNSPVNDKVDVFFIKDTTNEKKLYPLKCVLSSDDSDSSESLTSSEDSGSNSSVSVDINLENFIIKKDNNSRMNSLVIEEEQNNKTEKINFSPVETVDYYGNKEDLKDTSLIQQDINNILKSDQLKYLEITKKLEDKKITSFTDDLESTSSSDDNEKTTSSTDENEKTIISTDDNEVIVFKNVNKLTSFSDDNKSTYSTDVTRSSLSADDEKSSSSSSISVDNTPSNSPSSENSTTNKQSDDPNGEELIKMLTDRINLLENAVDLLESDVFKNNIVIPYSCDNRNIIVTPPENLVQVGDVENLVQVGDVENLAQVGDVENLVQVGDVDNFVQVGDVENEDLPVINKNSSYTFVKEETILEHVYIIEEECILEKETEETTDKNKGWFIGEDIIILDENNKKQYSFDKLEKDEDFYKKLKDKIQNKSEIPPPEIRRMRQDLYNKNENTSMLYLKQKSPMLWNSKVETFHLSQENKDMYTIDEENNYELKEDEEVEMYGEEWEKSTILEKELNFSFNMKYRNVKCRSDDKLFTLEEIPEDDSNLKSEVNLNDNLKTNLNNDSKLKSNVEDDLISNVVVSLKSNVEDDLKLNLVVSFNDNFKLNTKNEVKFDREDDVNFNTEVSLNEELKLDTEDDVNFNTEDKVNAGFCSSYNELCGNNKLFKVTEKIDDNKNSNLEEISKNDTEFKIDNGPSENIDNNKDRVEDNYNVKEKEDEICELTETIQDENSTFKDILEDENDLNMAITRDCNISIKEEEPSASLDTYLNRSNHKTVKDPLRKSKTRVDLKDFDVSLLDFTSKKKSNSSNYINSNGGLMSRSMSSSNASLSKQRTDYTFEERINRLAMPKDHEKIKQDVLRKWEIEDKKQKKVVKRK